MKATYESGAQDSVVLRPDENTEVYWIAKGCGELADQSYTTVSNRFLLKRQQWDEKRQEMLTFIHDLGDPVSLRHLDVTRPPSPYDGETYGIDPESVRVTVTEIEIDD